MNQENNHIDDTTNTFAAMASEMSAHSLKKTIKNVLSFVVILLVVTFIALLFSLPVFQASHVSLSGYVNFQPEEIVTMANLDGYHPNLLFDVDKSQALVMENAQGLILDCEFATNGFTSTGEIQEDYPVAKCNQEVYFSSGKLSEEIYASVNRLPLSDTSKNRLKVSYDNEMNGKLPTIHFPTGVEASTENAISAAKRFKGVPLNSLNYIDGVQFINDYGDVNWDNVATAILSYKGEYYQLDHLRSELFDKYFTSKDNFFEQALEQMYHDTHVKSTGTKEVFTYQDDNTSIETYCFHATYNDKEHVVYIIN